MYITFDIYKSYLNERPKNIPNAPDRQYKKTGDWKGWGDYLGTGRIANQNQKYISYEKAKEILFDDHYKTKQKKIRDQSLKNKIDVNKLIEWFILNYPDSYRNFKKDPDLQFKIN